MTWDEEQSRLTEEARLLLMPPPFVYEELKAQAEKIRNDRSLRYSRADKIEAKLIERNERLINLALACFCTDKDVFKALYNHSKEPASDASNSEYKRGLRIGCLSNETLSAASWAWRFPTELVGDEEVERIVVSGDWQEVEALLRNPACSDELLQQIFKRESPFAKLGEERLVHQLHEVVKNARINTNNDTNYDPDLGHYGIHRAIAGLIETSPVNALWFWALYTIIQYVNPSHVHSIENIEAAIGRWKDFEIEGYGDEKKPAEGHYVSATSIAEEFRCMLAAVYGGLKDDALKAAKKSDYLPMRCVYYAHANLKTDEMKAGRERDKGAYVLAVAFNSSVLLSQDKRRFYEEEQLVGRGIALTYKRNVDFLRERYRNMPGVSSMIFEDEEDKRQRGETDRKRREEDNDQLLQRVDTTTAHLQKKLDELSKKFQSFQSIVIIAVIACAVALYFHFKK